jgi:hypothetical protein
VPHKTSSERNRTIPKLSKNYNQLIVSQLASLEKAVHSLPDLHIDTVVVKKWCQVVLIHNIYVGFLCLGMFV